MAMSRRSGSQHDRLSEYMSRRGRFIASKGRVQEFGVRENIGNGKSMAVIDIDEEFREVKPQYVYGPCPKCTFKFASEESDLAAEVTVSLVAVMVV